MKSIDDAPFLDTAARVETLYLAALGRPPRPSEAARMVAYVDRGGTSSAMPPAASPAARRKSRCGSHSARRAGPSSVSFSPKASFSPQ